jgi:RNA polymerase sigma-70 factor (ECF subfamily)
LEETALVERAARQDAAAWEALVREHQQAVFRLAYLFTGDPDEAEDIAQEAFIRAFRSIDRADPERPFRPWVLSIAANLARNRLRGVKRYLAALQHFATRDPEAVRPARPDPDLHGETRALWESIRRLSLEDQQVIYLRYFLELTEENTAAALGIAQGTVKSRLHRALRRLRVRLLAQQEQENAEARHG